MTKADLRTLAGRNLLWDVVVAETAAALLAQHELILIPIGDDFVMARIGSA